MIIMTDAEQIEVWRKQFESEFDDVSQKYDSGIYRNSHRESMWQGFLMAKRSQPVIELPKPTAIDFGTLNSINSIDCLSIYSIGEAITAAGYKYKVKE